MLWVEETPYEGWIPNRPLKDAGRLTLPEAVERLAEHFILFIATYCQYQLSDQASGILQVLRQCRWDCTMVFGIYLLWD
jgi:hypothetical protein